MMLRKHGKQLADFFKGNFITLVHVVLSAHLPMDNILISLGFIFSEYDSKTFCV